MSYSEDIIRHMKGETWQAAVEGAIWTFSMQEWIEVLLSFATEHKTELVYPPTMLPIPDSDPAPRTISAQHSWNVSMTLRQILLSIEAFYYPLRLHKALL